MTKIDIIAMIGVVALLSLQLFFLIRSWIKMVKGLKRKVDRWTLNN